MTALTVGRTVSRVRYNSIPSTPVESEALETLAPRYSINKIMQNLSDAYLNCDAKYELFSSALKIREDIRKYLFFSLSLRGGGRTRLTNKFCSPKKI